MKTTFRTINAQGKAEIREVLAANHKLGADHFSNSMIDAWADEVQFSLDEGSSPSFEIRGYDSLHGRTQEFTLSDASFDTAYVDADE